LQEASAGSPYTRQPIKFAEDGPSADDELGRAVGATVADPLTYVSRFRPA